MLEVFVLLAAFFLGWYFQWETANFVFFILFIILIIHPIASRFSAIGAIVFLVATAILLAIKQDSWAETSAIWAYYLMIFTAVLAFYELHDEKESAIMAKN